MAQGEGTGQGSDGALPRYCRGAYSGNEWNGQDAGVRKPLTGETQLSAEEVGHGLRVGVLP